MTPVSEPISSGGSRWLKTLTSEGTIRGVEVHATELVQEAIDLHRLSDGAAECLGEALVAGLLMASTAKSGHRLNLNIRGTGRVIQALVDAYPEGSVRGYLIVREEGASFEEDGRKTGPWGAGLLAVLRTRDSDEGGTRQPYIGTVPLLTGHLAKDLAFYWAQSEQVPSAVGIAVKVEGKKVVAAGGFMIQALPGSSPEEVRLIEAHLSSVQDLIRSVQPGQENLAVLSKVFKDLAFMKLEERELKLTCNCSWERVRRALILTGSAELQSMLEQGEAIVQCDFCTKEYRADAKELEALVRQTSS